MIDHTFQFCIFKRPKTKHIPGDPACVLENMERIKEEVKKRLRSMGKHGDFEIEEVRE